MKTAFFERPFQCVATGVLALLVVLGTDRIAFGNAIQDRLLGDRLKPITDEEVSAVVEKHPDDAQLLYAASDYFSGTERGAALLARAIELDKRFEVVCPTQELLGLPPVGRLFDQWPMKHPRVKSFVPRAFELLERLQEIDPENALPHWLLATFAFAEDDAEKGFAHIEEALSRTTFATRGVPHLRARFRLLDALGRNGLVKFSILAASRVPDASHGHYLAEKLIERGDRKLAAGDRGGALADYAAADRLANQLLLARPAFEIRQLVAVSIKRMVAEARLKLYEAEGDTASAVGIRLQLRTLRDHLERYAITAERFPVYEVMHLEEWPALSEETLHAHLAQSKHFAAALDTAAEQVHRYLSLPEYEQMMNILFDTLFTEGGLASREKAIEFYEQSSLPQEQERLMEAVRGLREALASFPESKDRACISNLKRLGAAFMIYTSDRNGALPGSLEVLVLGGYVQDPSILKCPVSGTQYHYPGKGMHVKNVTNIPQTMLACDTAPVHDGKRHVLFLDGHVEIVSEKGFQHYLRQQQQSD